MRIPKPSEEAFEVIAWGMYPPAPPMPLRGKYSNGEVVRAFLASNPLLLLRSRSYSLL